jgi:hypothetical protein
MSILYTYNQILFTIHSLTEVSLVTKNGRSAVSKKAVSGRNGAYISLWQHLRGCCCSRIDDGGRIEDGNRIDESGEGNRI